MAAEPYTRKPSKLIVPGDRFGFLTVIKRIGHDKYYSVLFECACDCGNTKTIRAHSLMSGVTRSCGCYSRSHSIKHGHSYDPEYKTWQAIHQRCYNPNDCNFKHYGARGISVCARWNDVLAFIEDMGQRPSRHHSIERIDNDAGYSPDNCRWATTKEQANNKRSNLMIIFRGQRMSVAAACDIVGLKHYIVYNRIQRGWPEHEWFGPMRRKLKH